MDRAYSLLTIKSADEDTRTIRGIATTPAPDRMGDIVEPKGAEFKLPIPLLWQHDSMQPIGHVTGAKVTDEGIEIVASIARIAEPGTLKDRLDVAWQSIKSGLVGGLSIGFKGLEVAQIKDTMGIRFIKWLFLELSAVTIPANEQATIQSVKSIDAKLLALPSVKQQQNSVVRLDPSGVPGKRNPKTPQEGKTMKTIAEQITAMEAKRAASAAAQQAELQKSIEGDRTANNDEGDKFDDLQSEIETIDKQLDRLRKLERTMAGTAKAVVAIETAESASESRGSGLVVKTEPKLPPGIGLARYTKCVVLAAKHNRDPVWVAEQLYGPNSIVVGATKANVLAGTTVSGNWAAFLVGAETDVFADFAEWLRPQTILGRFGNGGIPSLRNVPFRVPLLSQTAGAAGYWVGEAKAKPLTSITGARTTLTPLKVATICVLTDEVIRDSSPKAEVFIRDELGRALLERVDTDFIDPTKSASSGVSPASITNSSSLSSNASGTDATAVFHDVKLLMAEFWSHNNPPTNGVWIMSNTNAMALSMMQNPLGQPWFNNVTQTGGTFFGIPVITSEYCDDNVILANASDIYFADEGGVMVDLSRDASLEMSTTPVHNSSTPTPSTLVSMFQTNSVAIRAERTLNWALRRATGVTFLTTVRWGGVVSDMTV